MVYLLFRIYELVIICLVLNLEHINEAVDGILYQANRFIRIVYLILK
jgi:hypothetical protein